MKAYTDYPLTDGDEISLREIITLSYDRNKYCTVEGADDWIKRGYVFKDAALTKRPTDVEWAMLPYEPNAKPRTKLQASQEVKADRRKWKATYTLWVGNSRDGFSAQTGGRISSRNLQEALHLFLFWCNAGVGCQLFRDVEKKRESVYESLVSCCDKMCVLDVNKKGRSVLKRRHFLKGIK